MSAVIKNNQLKAGGPCRIGASAATPASASAGPQVRMVERRDDGAVIEVRCACGRCTYVQCRWPAQAAPAAPKRDK